MISPVDGWLLPCQTGPLFLLSKRVDKADEMNIFKDGINIPKVVKKLELSGYHGDLKNSFIFVWVNLTRATHKEYADIQTSLREWSDQGKAILVDLTEQVEAAQKDKKTDKEIEKIRKKNEKKFDDHMESVQAVNDEMYVWYAKVWSQHKNEVHHCTADEVRRIAETSSEEDNSNFWGWITSRTQAMILQHGNQQLKK